MGQKTTKRAFDAREYLRVSLDKSGLKRSTGQQHNENQAAADERSWTLGTPYKDNDRSASRFARKVREDFDRLVSDLEQGRFDAYHLMLWEGSRGSREMEEWIRLVKLCEQQGVKFYITSEDRVLDPSNDHDWAALISLGQASEVESRKISKRVRRATRAAATAGRPHGRANYGYKRIYGPHPDTGKVVLLDQVIEESEAENVLELFERLDQGHSLKAIERDWAALVWAVPKRRRDGGVFSTQHLRKMAMAHAYAGLRLFTPGRTPGATDLTGTVVEASWPAIVEHDLFDRVQRRLSDPMRKTTRGGSAKHFVSLIVPCGECHGPLAAKNLPPGWRYVCVKRGCVKVPLSELDEYIEDEILTYLERDDVYRFLASVDDEEDEELTRVRSDLETVLRELEELQETLDRGEISAQMAGRSEAKKLERKAELEELERGLSAPAGLGPIAPGEDVRKRWKDAPLSARRETARALLAPEVLGRPMVVRAPHRGAPVADRVVWETENE
jgi:DNA invertase Pin-like site-specific DNA recombinase